MKQLIVYDTTLRDGEQAPGYAMSVDEKVIFAYQLLKLGVDVIEAGFPAASIGDAQAVKKISEIAGDTVISALSRIVKSDIIKAAEALANAKNRRINLIVPGSAIQIENQLHITKNELLERVDQALDFAAETDCQLQLSIMDSTRSEKKFLAKLIKRALSKGVQIINLSDTVGYGEPFEVHELVRFVKKIVTGYNGARLSVHFHNDLGLAVANTLAAVRAGVDQVECTVNGIGERAGNAALEEVVTAVTVRGELFNVTTEINSKEFIRTSMLLCDITEKSLSPNKPIVGSNAFAHGAGIHQDGMSKDHRTFEPFEPGLVGASGSTFVIGKHSGKRGVSERAKQLGYTIGETEADAILQRIKELCDTQQKSISDTELIQMLKESSGLSGGFRGLVE